jgi:hypothetical protein
MPDRDRARLTGEAVLYAISIGKTLPWEFAGKRSASGPRNFKYDLRHEPPINFRETLFAPAQMR